MAAAQADLERGREGYARQAWGETYRLLSCADSDTPLGAEDLERLADAAYLTGHDEDCLKPWMIAGAGAFRPLELDLFGLAAAVLIKYLRRGREPNPQ